MARPFTEALRKVEAERDRYREALVTLADEDNWGGDPRESCANLYGHFTPFELAREALEPNEKRERSTDA